MKHLKFLIPASIAAVAMLSSCRAQFDALLSSNDTDLKYESAFEYFNDGKYGKAAQLFESLSVLMNGTERDDTVQYYWGLSNYMAKDYYTAETNFSKFVETFPRSPFSSEAAFLRIDCLYRQTYRYELDQNPTRTAIQAINQYQVDEKSGVHKDVCDNMLKDLQQRLDKKEYENARLYYKMEDYKAARVAFKNILKDNSDNQYREDILYYTAMSSYKYASLSVQAKQKERYLVFIDDYYNFISENPDSKYSRVLEVMFKRCQKALGRYSGSDADLEEKAKDFEKTQKLLEKDQK
ncbi:MAG: outer membrane protein assembly factor BamD [Bacteroidales bacterium]|nr:outer membrane protein assembly factor BamD [Bacteroidales bacterium]